MDNTNGFTVSPKASGFDATSHFTCDLVKNSFKHKYFLKKIHELGVSLQETDLESLRRYKQLWLPLVHSHDAVELVPPPDIAWMWHCHRLAPLDYERFVVEEFGVILEANPPFVLQTDEECQGQAYVTRKLWEETHPKESFFLSPVSNRSETSPSVSRLLAGFDLLASTQRQATFLWQVSGERFEDLDFLNEGVENYYRFLNLKRNAKHILVPTYQIDLMWHTHILSSLSLYNHDCKALIGSTFHHDDSFNDRTAGGILDVSYRATKEIWRREYGIDYVVEGGMYRGEPPEAYFSEKWTATEMHGIGNVLEMGASSTSPPNTGQSTRWATVFGLTSDGKPAFIAVDTQYRSQLREKDRMDDYVLGKHGTSVGYFHLETRQAHYILCQRLSNRITRLENDVACTKCCCGSKQSVEKLEKQMEDYRTLLKNMEARRDAPMPSGKVGTDPRLYSDGFIWVYPAFMWDSCGGACGSNAVTGKED